MPGKKYYFWRTGPNRPFNWARIILISSFFIFASRLVYLQIIKGNYYWLKAEKNRIQYFHLPAPRGRIFDRNGIILAGNQPNFSLFISPQGLSTGEKNKIITKIHKITGRSKEKILKRFNTINYRPFGIINLVPYLSKDEIIAIEENSHYLPGVSIQVEPRRKYSFGENGSHFLGYLGEINSFELGKFKKYGYKLKDMIGKSGLEKVYDRKLRGNDGFQEIEIEVKGTHRKLLQTYNPRIGNDLLLTIDLNLQKVAYRAMTDKYGTVLVMNPNTGEILVWLSKPGFNPEDFTLPLTSDEAKLIFDNPHHPLFNRIIQGQYAPGSIFKLITAITALESKLSARSKEYICNGYIRIGYDNKIYRCWKDKKHGKLGLLDAIANSCNVYFYQLGRDVGAEDIYKTALKMGLGSSSQRIFKGENLGLIPSPEWKKNKFGVGWYPGDTANTSVGQGYVLVNPMQILKLVSAVAASGKVYAPYLVRMIISSSGKVIEKYSPKQERNIDISPATFEIIKEAMMKVTEYGTAQFLNLPFDVASKTSTAETPSGEDHAWFICFAPVDVPEIAIVVLVENGGYGSVAAMPVAREILKARFLNKKNMLTN